MATDKTTMLAEIAKINAVDGFDPTPFAVDFTDLSSGEVRKRLPVMIQRQAPEAGGEGFTAVKAAV